MVNTEIVTCKIKLVNVLNVTVRPKAKLMQQAHTYWFLVTVTQLMQ